MTGAKQIAVGDAVTFTWYKEVTRARSCNINFSTRTGTVLEMSDDIAIVKTKSGARHKVNVADLRLVGERSALTDAVMSGLTGEKSQ
ncbi:hypothetical protein [Herminiimonas arsenitoxidans]|uniref:hypothetical protein n=1 Tax=Herminiimonas arsenitoxidans TaxID=1809410 RepID=UPI0009709D9F|nr:hypothetical protein [Herminiimonas arsenitoxidans]